MKNKVILSTAFLGVCTIALSSFHDGPAHHGRGNRSGSAGSTNCSVCHGGTVNTDLALEFTLTDDIDNSTVTNNQYIPGHTYTVYLKGNHPNPGTYPHFGFQASVVNAAGANTGALGTATANTGLWDTDTDGINVIEHTAPLDKTGTSYIAQFKWTAPAAGSGNANIYAAMLIVDGDGTKVGDVANVAIKMLSEGTVTAIHDVKKNDLFSIYPNPAKSNTDLNIHVSKAGKYDVSITALDGKILTNTKIIVNSGNDARIDIAFLAKGVYVLTLGDGNVSQSTRFVKQ